MKGKRDKVLKGDVVVAPSTVSDVIAQRVAQAVQKKLGRESLMRLGDPEAYPEITHVISTGIPALDLVFGVGGVPGDGKLTEIFGPESSGKTTLTKIWAGLAQRQGYLPVLIDTEQSGVIGWDTGLGIDPSRALGGQPDTMEEVFALITSTVEAMQAAKAVGWVMWDSLAATPLASELALGFDEEGRMAGRAGYLARHLPKLMRLLKRGHVGLVIVNQVREVIGAGPYQKKTYSPGGRAIRHWTHVRLELQPFGLLKEGDRVVGIKTRVRAIKNKLAQPYREVVLEIRFDPPRAIEAGSEPKRTPMRAS